MVLAASGVGLGAAVLGWLAGANLLLALFNLLPGAPLDGGRILRAWLWRRHGDRLRATLTAAKAGRVVGGGLIGVGLAELFFGADGGGLWTIVIGWFLANAAKAEAAQAVALDSLGGLRVLDVMTRAPQRVPGWVSVDTFVDEYALAGRYSSFPVEDIDGRIVGLVTLAQVKARPRQSWPTLTVTAVMTPLEAISLAAPGEELAAVIGRGTDPGGRLLVFDGDRLVGIVSPSDLAWALERRVLGAAPAPVPAAGSDGPGGGERPAAINAA
ncbi:MAG: site-2 protease family protein [Actinomycetota bacterium]